MQVETDVILPQAFVNVVRNNDLDRHLTWQIGAAKQVVLSHADTKKGKATLSSFSVPIDH